MFFIVAFLSAHVQRTTAEHNSTSLYHSRRHMDCTASTFRGEKCRNATLVALLFVQTLRLSKFELVLLVITGDLGIFC